MQKLPVTPTNTTGYTGRAGYREGWSSVTHESCLSQPHTRISALSSPPRRCCYVYSAHGSCVILYFLFPIPLHQTVSSARAREAKCAGKNRHAINQTPELGGWSGRWGSHSGRWALEKKESGIQLLTCQKSIWEDPMEQEYEQLKTRDLPRFGGLNQVLASLVTQLTK